jgi:Acetokinase family
MEKRVFGSRAANSGNRRGSRCGIHGYPPLSAFPAGHGPISVQYTSESANSVPAWVPLERSLAAARSVPVAVCRPGAVAASGTAPSAVRRFTADIEIDVLAWNGVATTVPPGKVTSAKSSTSTTGRPACERYSPSDGSHMLPRESRGTTTAPTRPRTWRRRSDRSRRAAELLGRGPARLRLVTCHLGAGASLAVVVSGRSVAPPACGMWRPARPPAAPPLPARPAGVAWRQRRSSAGPGRSMPAGLMLRRGTMVAEGRLPVRRAPE